MIRHASTLNVDYDWEMARLSDNGKNAWATQQLHLTVEPAFQKGVQTVNFMLVELEEAVEGLETLSVLLAIDGLRLASAVELRAFARRYAPTDGTEQTVHALGSAFFNNPDEYPEEVGWFALLLKCLPDGSQDFWLESVMPRGGRLSWPAGTLVLAVKR